MGVRLQNMTRDLWKKYNYRDFGIIGEPYFDVDYSKVLYLTDTGRRWDGDKVNVRDRALGPEARGKRQSKSEERRGEFAVAKRRQPGLNPKSETNPNNQNSNDTNKKAPNDKISEFMNDSEQSERMTISDRELNDSEQSEQMTRSVIPKLHSTFDIIEALEKDLLPDQIMINTHPQRWTNNPFMWTKELVWQNMKNVIKRFYK